MNVIVRKASVRWKGGARGGRRALTTGSGALTRAELLPGGPLKNNSHVDPSELIAAA